MTLEPVSLIKGKSFPFALFIFYFVFYIFIYTNIFLFTCGLCIYKIMLRTYYNFCNNTKMFTTFYHILCYYLLDISPEGIES